ncbi:hypothetical protein SAY86_030608 [Trapa natans]|uniref:Dicer-like protein 4 n=1 Tax=Trapa natans TaxID=22666 RepID=A0AAN7M599_TRANT|nr:hypothetical protein SAY86_030608 [Trapa natans]
MVDGGAGSGFPSSSRQSDKDLTNEVPAKEAKDPRKIARKYQLELCEKALQENIVVCLGTGCGKTHIAVLLMHALRHSIKKPQKNICVFLAPTVALVQQQAKVIEGSTDFKVGWYSGGSKRLRNHEEWEKELEKYEVFVMTPRILLCNLSHCFMKMDYIALLIFDECHHAQSNSNHPYAEIMRVFYNGDVPNPPRIFGMTASPILRKVASDADNIPKSINSLETLLNAKVYSVEDSEELNTYISTPVYKVHYYDNITSGMCSSYATCLVKLKEIKRVCMSMLNKNGEDHQKHRKAKKMLNRMHDNISYCVEKLGFYGAVQACQILLNSDSTERSLMVEDDENSNDSSLSDAYLSLSCEMINSCIIEDGGLSDLSNVEILKKPFFSSKLLSLVGILSSIRLQDYMKCIVFVNRIVTARALNYMIQNLMVLSSWKSDFLVGVHSGLRSMSRRTTNITLDKFRSGKLNLLVATKVGEEGLDIQTCCLVIRFDLPETVSSFIQSRGRARMPQSEYIFLVDRGNNKEMDLIDIFKRDEERMNIEIITRTSNEEFDGVKDMTYKVDSTGAAISSGYSTSLLHEYCAKLPHDEYFDPKVKFYYFDSSEGTVCQIILPPNAPIHQISSSPQSSMENARKVASLCAIQSLHKLGSLNDFLLPLREKVNQEVDLINVPLHSDDETSREDLYEMFIPAALSECWSYLEDVVTLYPYYIDFRPSPADRTYKEFGLFVKSPLPLEAEKLELDLHLAHSRSVMVKLIPMKPVAFGKDEIVLAENFHELCLRVILDRSDFVCEDVVLGKNSNSCRLSTLAFYLLLPVTSEGSHRTVIDWITIKRCLSSPMFSGATNPAEKEYDDIIELANGRRSKHEVENSLVYVPYKKKFFYVTNINYEKNGYSLYPKTESSTFAEFLAAKSGIFLEWPEQSLLHVKPVFYLRNLLHNRKQEEREAHDLDEYFIDLPPEVCQLKILGFSKEIGSSLSLLPSFMHHLENFLVAVQLKDRLASSFPEGAQVTASRVLEALTTEKCQERISLERLEILGDAFLKFAVGRHLFLLQDTLDEGQLTRKRSNSVNNSTLFKLAIRRNLQGYIRDQPFEPSQFFALGRPCPHICNEQTKKDLHFSRCNNEEAKAIRCSRCHIWLQNKTIADVVEALVGAFLVDSGFKAASAFLKWIGIEVDFDASHVDDACISSSRFMPLAELLDVSSLEDCIGYKFHHRGLLLQAFLHPSYSRIGGGCYQRLEFLGDAVLDYLMTSYLFSVYPKLNPGQLTDLRSVCVNNKAFAHVALERNFHKFLICDSDGLSNAIKEFEEYLKKSASERCHLEPIRCPKVLGDLVESSVGAILLDSGFDLNCTWKVMLSFLKLIMSFSSCQLSPIRDLQELCQSHNWDLKFSPTKKGSLYFVEAQVVGENMRESSSSTNLNKKEAIKTSAGKLFLQLKSRGYFPKVKSLEEVLRQCEKMEPKLIGFDETPIEVISPDLVEPGTSSYWLSLKENKSPKRDMVPQRTVALKPLIKQQTNGLVLNKPAMDLEATDGLAKKSAKSRLYEICAANCWKPPTFDCCNEEGLSHTKMFTYKAVIEIEEASGLVVECFGEPRSKKKGAAEHAAEGALWYLKQEGYLLKSEQGDCNKTL